MASGGYEPGIGSDTAWTGQAFASTMPCSPPGTWDEAGVPREGMAFNHP